MPAVVETPEKKRVHVSFSFDLRVVVALLLLVILLMLVIWKPWEQPPQISGRTVTVTGTAQVSAEPDEYIFTPTYSFSNNNKQAALDTANKKANEIVAKLKSLGVADSKIKTDVNGFGVSYQGVSSSLVACDTTYANRPEACPPDPNPTTSYNLLITVTINKRTLAQKVEDYLITTAPEGTVTPQITFSETTSKKLEAKARDEATKDARGKASQTAENLGFKLGAVKSVSDNTGFGIYPVSGAAESDQASSGTTKLAIQPGENKLDYTVSVVYYIR